MTDNIAACLLHLLTRLYVYMLFTLTKMICRFVASILGPVVSRSSDVHLKLRVRHEALDWMHFDERMFYSYLNAQIGAGHCSRRFK